MKRYVAFVLVLIFYASVLPWSAGAAPNASFNTTRTNDLISKGPWVDVRASFNGLPGAAGDNTTNDSVAFQRAMNAPLTNTSANVITVPPGHYRFSSTVTWTYHNTKIRGSGKNNTFIEVDTGITAFSPPGGAGEIGRNGIEISDLTIRSRSGTPDAYAFTSPDNVAPVTEMSLSIKVYRCEFNKLLNVYNPEIATRNIYFTGNLYEDTVFNNAPVNMISLKHKNVLYFNRCEWTGMTQNTAAFQLGGGTQDAIGIYYNDCRWDVNDREALRFSAANSKATNVAIKNGYFENQYADGGSGSAIRFDNSVIHLYLENVYATDSGNNASGRPFIGGASYASPITIKNSTFSYYDDIDPTMAANASVNITYLGWNQRNDSGVNGDRHNWFGKVATAYGGLKIKDGRTITYMYGGYGAPLGFGATAANSCEDNTATIAGAEDGDIVTLGIPNAMASIAKTLFTGWVSASSTVTVRRCNIDNSATTATSGNILIFVWH